MMVLGLAILLGVLGWLNLASTMERHWRDIWQTDKANSTLPPSRYWRGQLIGWLSLLVMQTLVIWHWGLGIGLLVGVLVLSTSAWLVALLLSFGGTWLRRGWRCWNKKA